MHRLAFATLLALPGFFVHAQPVFVYDEALLGDLSGFGSAPTALAFLPGQNIVVGTMGGEPTSDPDIIRFTIDPGYALTSIYLEPLEPAERSFFALAEGPTINMTDGTTHLGNLLTYFYGELLGELSLGGEYGGQGFSTPLGAGTYTTWIQEVSTRVDYSLVYTITAIPEPASSPVLAALVTATFVACRRRRV